LVNPSILSIRCEIKNDRIIGEAEIGSIRYPQALRREEAVSELR